MSQAQDLLNSLSVAAETPVVLVEPVNDVLLINPETRTINVPDSELLFGVTGDGNVERKYFKCPRIVGDNIDLSLLGIRIPYRTSGGYEDVYPVSDMKVVGDYITFSWQLNKVVFTTSGPLTFAICAVKVDSEGYETNEWNTVPATGNVLAGLQVAGLNDYEEYQARDVLQQLLNMLNTKSEEAVQNVENATAEQIAAVEEKGAEVLASIPEDYTTTYNTAEEALRTKADAIVLETTGKVITVDNSSEDPVRGLKVFGRSEQIVTTGAQLANLPDVDPVDQAGIIWSCKNGIIRAVGTATAVSPSSGKGIYYNLPPKAGTYFVSGSTEKSIVYASVRKADGTTSYYTETAFTLDGNEELCQLYCQVHTNASVNDTVYLMLNSGDTALSWEPYSGGYSSPSPEWPQEITSLGESGNLFDDTNFRGITLEAAYYDLPVPITKPGTYTLSCDITGITEHGLVMSFGDETSNALRQIAAKTGTATSFTMTEEELSTFTKVTIYPWSGSVGGTLNWIMLNEGNQALDYRLYTGQKEIITSLVGLNFIDVSQMELASNVSLDISDDKYTITVVGGSANTYAYSHYDLPDCLVSQLRGKTVTLSADFISKSLTDAYSPVQMNIKRANGGFNYPVVTDTKLTATFVIPEDTIEIRFGIYTNNSATVLSENNTVVVKGVRLTLMEKNDYELYVPIQSFVTRVGDGLYGIPVISEGTYTDSNGQQWIADYVDEEKCQLVRNVGHYVFDGSDDEIWYYDEAKELFKLSYLNLNNTWNILANVGKSFMTHYKFVGEIWNTLEIEHGYCINFNSLFIRHKSITTLDAFKEYIALHPIELFHILPESIITPLTSEEIETFKTLHTNYPHTIVLNTENTFMELKYNADTKTYINQNGVDSKPIECMLLTDTTTGKIYKVTVTDGQINIAEVV